MREIEAEMEGVAVLGREAICRQNPRDSPSTPEKRSPAPRFHAADPQVQRALEWGYRLMRIAYRQASAAWRAGEIVEFPPGCFVPGRYQPLRS